LKVFSVLVLIIFFLTSAKVSAAENDIAKTVNNFSRNYFSKLDKDKNIFYSPYSIAAAFSIVANGAKGQTQKEILSALNAKNIDSLNQNFKNFRAGIEENYRDGVTLNEADLILIDKNFIGKGINKNFQSVVEDFYQSEIDAADFQKNLDSEKFRIKNFVAEKTNDFISDYESAADESTILDLLNVIYFKGDWENPFNAKNTWKSFFTNRDGSKIRVQMMAQTFKNEISYYADEKFVGIELPYKNNLAAMYVILPRFENFLNVAESWDAENFSYRENFLANIKNAPPFEGNVEVFIPKFELDIKNNLVEDLQKMGIRRAFTNSADFSNIVKNTRLKISNATHQAKLKVDETGTEAAAVTEITMVKATALATPPKTIYFRADRPFLFLIRDAESDVNLFAGVVNSLQ